MRRLKKKGLGVKKKGCPIFFGSKCFFFGVWDWTFSLASMDILLMASLARWMNRWSMVQWALKSQRSLDKRILHRFLQASESSLYVWNIPMRTSCSHDSNTKKNISQLPWLQNVFLSFFSGAIVDSFMNREERVGLSGVSPCVLLDGIGTDQGLESRSSRSRSSPLTMPPIMTASQSQDGACNDYEWFEGMIAF